MNNKEYITGNIENHVVGEGKYQGKSVIVCNGDIRVATGQIYCLLSRDPQYGFKIGAGIVKKGTDQQYRPLSYEEWEQACLSIFVFARLQESVGAAAQCLEILKGPPPLFLVTCKQGRWLTPCLEKLYPLVDGPEAGVLISRP